MIDKKQINNVVYKSYLFHKKQLQKEIKYLKNEINNMTQESDGLKGELKRARLYRNSGRNIPNVRPECQQEWIEDTSLLIQKLQEQIENYTQIINEKQSIISQINLNINLYTK